MGVSKSTIIGPYLNVEGKIELEKVKVKRVCPNHSDKETSDKFCSKCGSEVISVEFIDRKKVTPAQFSWSNTDFGDEIWSPEGYDNVFIPSMYPPNNIKVDEDGDFVDLSNCSDTINLQVDWFKANFSKQISLFEDNFGKENVKVMWGVASYWS